MLLPVWSCQCKSNTFLPVVLAIAAAALPARRVRAYAAFFPCVIRGLYCSCAVLGLLIWFMRPYGSCLICSWFSLGSFLRWRCGTTICYFAWFGLWVLSLFALQICPFLFTFLLLLIYCHGALAVSDFGLLLYFALLGNIYSLCTAHFFPLRLFISENNHFFLC